MEKGEEKRTRKLEVRRLDGPAGAKGRVCALSVKGRRGQDHKGERTAFVKRMEEN